ncbi:MAG: family intrarane metalloprotease protein [Clostridia bacterium]|jgi:membrane protease YdiL (CAAX protease family)|nr:family intrarane metalloprotease protein [Clostridia bacterium]
MFINKEGKVRSGWKVLMAVAGIYVALWVVFFAFHRLSYAFVKAAADTQVMIDQKWSELYNLWFKPLIIIQNIIMIAVPIWIWKSRIKRPLMDMGLSPIKSHKRELAAGLAFGALSITLVFVLLLFVGNAEVRSWIPVFSADTIIYLFIYIMVGFGEEVLGRGYIMSVLRQTKNVPLIVIVSAVIFSLLHMANPSVNILPLVNIFLVGVLFAYMYLKSGNIWMPIGYHITWNYFQGNVYGFPVSGIGGQGIITTRLSRNTIMNGGEFGPEGGLVVTIIIIIGFAFVKWYYRKKEFSFIEMD